MGGSPELNLSGSFPASVMMVGLQGSGKTTTCGKLGVYLKEEVSFLFWSPLIPSSSQRTAKDSCSNGKIRVLMILRLLLLKR